MINNISNFETVAKAVRVELDKSNGKIYLVFEIIDEELKQKTLQDWTKDIELKLIGRELTNV